MVSVDWEVFIILFLVWLSHFLPICDGIEKKFKFKKILSSALASVISLIPFANIVFALWGVIYGWRWRWWQAVIYVLIIWSIVFYLSI